MISYIDSYDNCPTWAPLAGYAGVALCAVLANYGAAVGTYK